MPWQLGSRSGAERGSPDTRWGQRVAASNASTRSAAATIAWSTKLPSSSMSTPTPAACADPVEDLARPAYLVLAWTGGRPDDGQLSRVHGAPTHEAQPGTLAGGGGEAFVVVHRGVGGLYRRR